MASMLPLADDVALVNHFTFAIYPFSHEVRGKERQARLQVLASRWAPWWSRLPDDQLASVRDDSYFFLPYIRGVLYPDAVRFEAEPPGGSVADWVPTLRAWTGEGLPAFDRELPPGSLIRLTCRDPLRSALARFRVVQHDPSQGGGRTCEVEARLEWLDAVLFPTGIGFLIAKVGLCGAAPPLSHLIELNYALRTVQPPTLSWRLPVLQFENVENGLRVRDLLEFLTQGISGAVRPLETELSTFRPEASSKQSDSENHPGKGYGERCQLFCYGCIQAADAERAGLPAGPFSELADRLLFEIAACIGLGQSVNNPAWVPSAEQVQRLTAENRVAPWRCWRAMVLKDSVVFLGTEDLPFNRHALSHNIESDYLPLYLYTLHQRSQLFLFAESLTRDAAQAKPDMAALRSLMEQFVNFHKQYWFNEVTRSPLGGDLYHKFQQGLEIPALYSLVTGTVKDVRDYYEELRDRKLQFFLNALTFVFVPMGVALAASPLVLSKDTPVWSHFVAIAVVVAGTWGVLFGLWKWQSK
jgi:hypothetical protein